MIKRSDVINPSFSPQDRTCGCSWSTEKAVTESLQVWNATPRGSESKSFLARLLYVFIALLNFELKDRDIGRAGLGTRGRVLRCTSARGGKCAEGFRAPCSRAQALKRLWPHDLPHAACLLECCKPVTWNSASSLPMDRQIRDDDKV